MKPRAPYKFKTEEELAAYVVQWLEEDDWDVYKEVQLPYGYKVADIVAVKHDIVWIIECKNTFSEAVLEQAYHGKIYSHYISVAVPIAKKDTSIVKKEFMRNNGIGLIKVGKEVWSNNMNVKEVMKPVINRKMLKYIQKTHDSLHVLQKSSKAGAQTGGHITPYKITATNLRNFLKTGPKTITEIVNSIDYHYRSPSTAKACIAKGVLMGWIKGVVRDGNNYILENDCE